MRGLTRSLEMTDEITLFEILMLLEKFTDSPSVTSFLQLSKQRTLLSREGKSIKRDNKSDVTGKYLRRQ